MRRRTPSVGALAGDGVAELTRLPPRSPLAAVQGLRTPPTCPASPLLGACFASTSGLSAASPLSAGGRSNSSTPARSRRTSCNALPLDLPQSSVLPSIVTSVFESNITAAQCYSAFPGRMHTAPPLVGRGDGHNHPSRGVAPAAAPGSLARGAIVAHSHHGHVMGDVLGVSSNLANDFNDVDFGLAACLATPLDPGPGLERRLAPLPATTTAARSAAAKLTSANDILNEASRYGDWVRRQRRRKRLERMQGALAELGASSVLGRLVDDTLHEYDPIRRRSGSSGGSGGGGRNDSPADFRSARELDIVDRDCGTSADSQPGAESAPGQARTEHHVGAVMCSVCEERGSEEATGERERARRALEALLREEDNERSDGAEQEEDDELERCVVFRDDMAFNAR